MEYTEKVIETFQSPKNMGEITNADAVGKVGNPVCGDLMWMFLKIEKNKDGKDYIKDVKVKTFGCVAAIATSSAMTELIMGKTIEEAEKIKKDDIVKMLGGLPKEKVHCSLLATEAFTDALNNWKAKKRAGVQDNPSAAERKNEIRAGTKGETTKAYSRKAPKKPKAGGK